jgi:signal-transduction protein with cAMP-binding, CBS, and nucleotidyltransferase domain
MMDYVIVYDVAAARIHKSDSNPSIAADDVFGYYALVRTPEKDPAFVIIADIVIYDGIIFAGD